MKLSTVARTVPPGGIRDDSFVAGRMKNRQGWVGGADLFVRLCVSYLILYSSRLCTSLYLWYRVPESSLRSMSLYSGSYRPI